MNIPGRDYFHRLRSFSRNARLYLGGSFTSNIVVGAFGALLNLYVVSLGYNKDFVGVLVSIQLFASGFGALPAGMICDRIGRRKSLVLSAMAICAGTLGLAWSTKAPWLIAFKALYGFAFAFLSVTVAPFLMESSTAHERSHLFGINFAAHTFAMMFGNFISGFLTDGFARPLGQTTAYRMSLTVFALLTLGAAVCYALIHETGTGCGKAKARDLFAGLAQAARLPQARQLIIYNALIGLGAGMVVPFFNVFLSEKLGSPARTIGSILALSQVATGLASLASPLVVQKRGKIRAVVETQLLSIPFLLMIALPPYVGIVTIAFFARSALMNMSNPIISNLSMEIVPAHTRAAISSFARMANDGVRAVSAVGAGLLMQHVSLEAPYFVTSVVYAAASIYYSRVFKRYEDNAPRVHPEAVKGTM